MNVFCHHEHSHSHADDPMRETIALLGYMIDHNAAHAHELEHLAHQLSHLGKAEAAAQVTAAVNDFNRGNESLAAVLQTLK